MLKHSPEQISLALKGEGVCVSHHSIYAYIQVDKSQERPKSVDSRLGYGDWVVDLREGVKSSGFILNLYECKSRLGRLCKLLSKSSQETLDTIIREPKGYKVRTLIMTMA